MLKISTNKLVTYNIGFKTSFQDGFIAASTDTPIERVATIVPSDTYMEEYGWLHDIPQIREWVGDRQINALVADGYLIKNKDWEQTVGVKANDLNDDRVGLYAPRFKMMGDEVARFPSRMAFGALKNGQASKCFDGQPFFSTAHPYTKNDGTVGTQSNFIAGDGVRAANPWYLMCTARPLKPIIYQNRQSFEFVSLDRPDDPNVFMKKELLYGVDGRSNVGYGFWQMAVCSTNTLDAAGFKAARQLMEGLFGDGDKPLGLVPDVLAGGTPLRDDAEATLLTQHLAGGADNPLYKAVEILITPYLN